MLKYHKRKSGDYRKNYKFAVRFIKRTNWDFFMACRELNSRRRMKIKAKRWSIRHDCYSCQQEHLTPDLVAHVSNRLGVFLDAVEGYHPLDELFPGACRECRFIMRGGKH